MNSLFKPPRVESWVSYSDLDFDQDAASQTDAPKNSQFEVMNVLGCHRKFIG